MLGLSKQASSQKTLADFISFWYMQYVHELFVYSWMDCQILEPIFKNLMLQLVRYF